MDTLKNMIKEEPELCIIDDPYVHFITEPFEETQPDSTIDVPGEKESLDVNVDPVTRNRRICPFRSRPVGFYSKCSVCGKSFEKVSDFELHMSQVHHIQPYECSICDRKFSRKSYLAPHMRVHSGERPYSCQHCSAAFSRASDFKKHNRSHQGIKSFKCELCDKRFTRAYSLRHHLSGHTGEKKFVCKICGIGFRKSTGYYYHKKTLCKNTFECVYCKKKFNSRDTMVYHFKTRH